MLYLGVLVKTRNNLVCAMHYLNITFVLSLCVLLQADIKSNGIQPHM